MTEVSAQNYSSETGSTCTGTGILCDAMNSEADIYTIVFDEYGYVFENSKVAQLQVHIYSGT